MSFSMSHASIDAFTTTLDALSGVLDKGAHYAAEKKIDPAVLLASRLYSNMFTLTRQVQIVTDGAKGGTSRLAGVEPPKYEDNETTFEQLKDRLARTVAYLKTLDRAKIDASADREIVFPVGPTDKMKMKGADYLTQFVIPNLYFHATTAYGILRHCGVDLGKRDYLGKLPATPA